MQKTTSSLINATLDLCRICDGIDLIIVFLKMQGYVESEIAQIMGVSRQTIYSRLAQIRNRYRTGQRKTASGRSRKKS